MLASAKQVDRALDICEKHNVKITEDMAGQYQRAINHNVKITQEIHRETDGVRSHQRGQRGGARAGAQAAGQGVQAAGSADAGDEEVRGSSAVDGIAGLLLMRSPWNRCVDLVC